MMQLEANECWQTPEARSKEKILSDRLQRENVPADTLISAQ